NNISVLRNAEVVPPPTITSFTPLSAKSGDVVTITGTNFNTTPANNIVFFGATRATVTAATATNLTVTVPSGATYAPITVLNTSTSLAAFSLASFNPIFSPAKTGINSADFAAKVDFTTGANSSPYSAAIGDLDGDGKPDLAVTNNIANTVSVFRNTASSGSFSNSSFAAKADFATGSYPYKVAIGDLDGDGKPDLAIVNYGSNDVSILRNTSTSGVISFVSKQDFTTGANSQPVSLAIDDLNGDGKPDIATSNFTGNNVSILRNTSLSGTIGFETPISFTTGTNSKPNSIAIGDLDGDGKPDIATANFNTNNFSVFRNTSTSGTIGFATKQDFSTGTNSQPVSVAIGDLDGDGKQDLALLNLGTATISVFRNTANSGSIGSGSFAAKVDFATLANPRFVTMGDLNGDGKTDLVTVGMGLGGVSVFRNTTTGAGIASNSFAAKQDMSPGLISFSVAIGDLDGDGKPDFVIPNLNLNNISLLRNADIITSPTITLSGTYTTPNICSSNEKKYGQVTLNAINIADSVVVTAPSGFKISKRDTTGYTNSLVYYPTAGKIIDSIVYITVANSLSNPTPGTNYSFTDSLLFSSPGAVSKKFGVSVNILGKPTNVSITVLGAKPTRFCSGDSIILQSAATNATRFEWLDSSMHVIGTGTTYTAKLSNVYGLKAYNSNNCSSDTMPTVPVNVNALPTATITQGSTLAFTNCNNTTITLTANTGSSFQYQWQDSLGAISGQTNQSMTVSSAGKYRVRVTDSVNCSAISDITNIIALPTTTVTGSTSVCAGNTVALSANATGFTSPTFAWSKDGTPIPSAANINYTANATGSYTVAITSGSITSISCPIQVTVNPLPVVVASSSATPATVCQGQALTLSASGAKTYNWYTTMLMGGGTTPPTLMKLSASTNANFSPTIGGYYNLEGTDSLGCTSTNAAGIAVTINPVNNNVTVQNPANIISTDSVMVLNYAFSTSPTTKYSVTAGTNAMPGFVAITNGNLTNTGSSGIGSVSIPVPKPTVAGTYDFNFYAVNGSSGCASSAKAFTLTVVNPPAPSISSVANFPNFQTCSGVASPPRSFRVSGENLTANVTVTAPTGFEVSEDGTNFDNAIDLQALNGTINFAFVYVRIASTATGNLSGNIALTSTGATTQNVAVSGTVNAVPTITLGSVTDINTSATNFSLPYSATTGSPDQYSISVGTPTAMLGFVEVSNDSLGSSPIVVAIPASAADTYNFVFTVRNSTTGCVSANNNFTVSVVAPTGATINSITKGTPVGATTNASSVTYNITFDTSVTGLSASNFSLTTSGVSGASIGTLSGSGANYTLTVNTGTGDGSITLNLDNATGLTPGITTTLPFAGEAYTIDKTNPTVVTQNSTVYLSAAGTGSITAAQVNNGSSDASGISGLSIDSSSFTCANIGTNTVTLTVMDSVGNTNTGTATVTVLDTIKPVVNTQNRTIYLNASGNASITAFNINNGSTDNCSVASIAASKVSFDCSNVGANTVWLTVTDASGNKDSASVTVTVLDTIKPSVVAQNSTIYLNAAGTASIMSSQINNGSTDNCSVASIAA
ncbi:MAG: hypothetical protein EAY81_00780, partial [Bacteroidetes bacterium]